MSAAPVKNPDRTPRGTPRWVIVAALALAGVAFGWTSFAERLDLMLLDQGFGLLRTFDPKPAPDDIVIVGIDEATQRAVTDPIGLWHVPLAQTLGRIASAKPRALALDIILPDRSMEAVRPGLDRALMEGLVAARTVETLVLGLAVDAKGEAKPVHTPYLAVVGVERLGLVIFGRDIDGVTRRYSLALPTDDGTFPTLVGRLCAGISKGCRQGMTDYSLGSAYRYVSMARVLEMNDAKDLERLFGGRIVFVGETQPFTDRVAQPLNLAGWEQGGRDAPGVLAHAQALRTALHGRPIDGTNPAVAVLLISFAALVFMAGHWPLALVCAALASLALLATSLLALRSGLQIPVAAALVTVALAATARAAYDAWTHARERDRLRLEFAGYVSPSVLEGILSGAIEPGHRAARRKLAFVFADLRGSTAFTAQSSPEEAMALLNRFHDVVVGAVHRHEGFLDNVRGDGVMAVFGAPKALPDPAASAFAAVTDMFRGLERLNTILAREGKPALSMAVGAAAGEAVVGHVGSRERFSFTAIGDAVNVAARLQEEAKHREHPFVMTAEIRAGAGSASLVAFGPVELRGRAAEHAWGWKPA